MEEGGEGRQKEGEESVLKRCDSFGESCRVYEWEADEGSRATVKAKTPLSPE